jgi:maltose/maltodextrin transport system substrate-binding protein/arabinogalactan oligomer/maltooligosaccharide transport system substrate-binding protein
MRNSIRIGGLLVALVMLLAACTGPGATPTPSASPSGTAVVTASPTGAPSDTPSTEPSITPSPSPSPPPGAVAGTLTIWADETRAPVFEAIGAAFAASEFGVPVVVHQLGFGDIRDYLILRGPNGEGPDIIIGAHDWLGQLVTAGVVEPLDLGDKLASFDEVAIDAMTYDGTLYGMPYATEAIALYYNKDLVPEPPATWDELKSTALALQNDAASGVVQGLCLQQGDPYHTYPLLTGFGGYIFGRDPATNAYNPQDVGLDTEGGIAYANELDQLVKDGLLRPDIDYGACLSQMTTEQSAFWITGPWALGDFTTSGINFGVAPIPTMENTPAPFVGVQGMMVSSFAPNKLIAQTFLNEFMAADDAMGQLFEVGQRPPAWLPTAATVTDENVIAFTTSGADGNPMPAIPEMSSVWTSWTDAINLIFRQEQEAEAAIRDAATEIRETIGE